MPLVSTKPILSFAPAWRPVPARRGVWRVVVVESHGRRVWLHATEPGATELRFLGGDE